jgi:peroxiredoxin Q/BCP
MLKPGTVAPDFALPDQDGREQRLSALLAGSPLILYFYPADFTPGCTK